MSSVIAGFHANLGFFVTSAGHGGLLERMTIRGNGNVGIGTTTPAGLLQLRVSSGDVIQRFDNAGNAGGQLDLRYKFESSQHRVGFADTNGNWLFYAQYATPNTSSTAFFPGSVTVGGNISAKYQVVAECAHATVDGPYGRMVQLLYKGALIPGDAPQLQHLLKNGFVVKVGDDETGGVDAAGIPSSEDVICMIAIGYPPDGGVRVARSPRRPVEQILTMH